MLTEEVKDSVYSGSLFANSIYRLGAYSTIHSAQALSDLEAYRTHQSRLQSNRLVDEYADWIAKDEGVSCYDQALKLVDNLQTVLTSCMDNFDGYPTVVTCRYAEWQMSFETFWFELTEATAAKLIQLDYINDFYPASIINAGVFRSGAANHVFKHGLQILLDTGNWLEYDGEYMHWQLERCPKVVGKELVTELPARITKWGV